MRKNVHLVCGGRYHDFDFVRLELLKLLARMDHVRVTVANGYEDQENLHRAQALVTYTCDLVPLEGEQDALQQFLREGGKWFALHSTNARLEYDEETRRYEVQRVAPRFYDMLGSQAETLPPARSFTVRPSRAHPLVDGIEPFEVDDQLYLCRYHGEHECLLETGFSGPVKGFSKRLLPHKDRVPLMYLHPWEDNEILYLSLGHARDIHDEEPRGHLNPEIIRGSWQCPEFYELLTRGILWSLGELEKDSPSRRRSVARRVQPAAHLTLPRTGPR